nr:hypothetical protein [Tanacetum cinerariifolium]
MRRVGKGCSGVETPLFEGMIAAREPENQGHAEEQGDEEEQGNGNNAVEEHVTAVDDRIESSDDTHMEDMSNQGRRINESEKDQGAKMMTEKETEEVRINPDDPQVEGRQVDIYHIDMDHATKVFSMQEDEPKIQEAVEVVTTAKLITKVIAAVSETVSAPAVVQADVPAALVNAATVMTTAAPVKVAVPSTRRRKEW